MISRTVAAIGCAGMLFWAPGQGSMAKSAFQNDNDEKRGVRRERRKAFYMDLCVLSELCVECRDLTFATCSKSAFPTWNGC